jgi:DNA-binding response OmpR family regulator
MAGKKTKRILVVEDYPSLRDLYNFVLTRAGYLCDVANDGIEALQLTSKKKYDAILLDLLLQNVSGVEFLREYDAAGKHPDVKIIVISNVKHPSVVSEVESLGADAFYVKSTMTPDGLLKKMQELLKAE